MCDPEKIDRAEKIIAQRKLIAHWGLSHPSTHSYQCELICQAFVQQLHEIRKLPLII